MKYMSHVITPFLILLTVLVSLSACSALLDEDFESYAIGEVPTGPIPGPPTCDSIVIHGMPAQFAVCTTHTLAGNRSLAFLPPLGEEESIIDFGPCTPTDNRRPIIFSWQGRLESDSESPGVVVRIVGMEDSLFHSYLSFRVRPTNMEIRSGSHLIRTLNGDFSRPHTIIARISPATDYYYISVVGEGISEEEASFEGDLSEIVDFSLPGVMLRMEWMFGAGLDSVYRIDEVYIYRIQN